MLHLPTVDLIVTEGVNARKAIHPLIHSVRFMRFRRVLLFAPELPEELDEYVTGFIPSKWNYEEWNRFMVKELTHYVPNGHILNIHFDGFILAPNAWDPAWLDWDYIGSPWGYADNGFNVGNGGFSLRSAFYLQCSAKLPLKVFAPEDHMVIRESGPAMVEMGVKYAPEKVAAKFALERNARFGQVWAGQFGYHDNGTNISAAFMDPVHLHQMPAEALKPRC